MEVDRNQEDGKQERGRRVLVSLNPYAIVIDKNQREDGTGGEKRGAVVGFFQSSRHGKRTRHWKERHMREHKHPNPLVRYPDPHALNGTKTPLGS